MSGSKSQGGLPSKFDAVAGGRSKKRNRPPPVSIRFNADEHAALSKKANGETLGRYIKSYVLSGHKTRSKSASKEQQTIAKTLRGLGQSGVSGALSTLLLAVEEGRLLIDREDEKALRRAATDVGLMRSDLIAALGLHRDGDQL